MGSTKAVIRRFGGAVVTIVATIVVSAAGCGSEGTTTSTSGGGLNCGTGLTNCGVCAILSSDPNHCGSCDNVCQNGDVCSDGVCSVSCGGGTTNCNGGCADTDVDPNNCGACDKTCATGEVCSAGVCSLTCGGGSTNCNGGCVDTDVDPNNCGGCGTKCTNGEICSSGQCALACVGGTTNCNGGCVDTDVDPNNCGGCGTKCTNGEVCSAGSCSLNCVGGSTLCSGSCVDLDLDPKHCGSCTTVCPAGQVCSAGQCTLTCNAGTTNCSGACVDTQVDSKHCGNCATVCPLGQSCTAGQCALVCTGGTTACNGKCVDTGVDPQHCGACNVACAAGTDCVSGQCVSICLGGQTYCNGACVDTTTNTSHCGMCGNACPAGNSCVMGMCQAPTGYYVLTGTPNPQTVFNNIAETYRFSNNLTNSIWHRPSNMILTGEFMLSGYWAFPQGTLNYPTSPNNGANIHARMVSIPATATVIYSVAPSVDGVGPATSSQFHVANIDVMTGLLSSGTVAVFGDGHAAGCRLTSSSATEFLCYDGTVIRRYGTTAGSAMLTHLGNVNLSMALPTIAQCAPNNPCYGSTFAFDGAYYYFSAHQGSSNNLSYLVYSANGNFVSSYVASGAGSINGVYFDWWVGRYSAHDGFGGRSGGLTYGTGGGSDTHCFGPVSSAHTLQ